MSSWITYVRDQRDDRGGTSGGAVIPIHPSIRRSTGPGSRRSRQDGIRFPDSSECLRQSPVHGCANVKVRKFPVTIPGGQSRHDICESKERPVNKRNKEPSKPRRLSVLSLPVYFLDTHGLKSDKGLCLHWPTNLIQDPQ